jgi:selenocysteine lyase/cysteine desulfurase
MSAAEGVACGAAGALRGSVVGVDEEVLLRDGRGLPYANLDNAASTPPLREVMDAVQRFLPWYASVHRGSGTKSRFSTHAYDEAHATALRFVGADPREHVAIFGKNSTEALNKLSYRLALRADDVVIASALEHHSNDLPWRARCRVLRIACDARGRLDEDHARHLLRRHAGRVRLLAVTGGSNVTGHLPAIHSLATLAHAAGAQIAVDAAQLAPHRRIDMRPLADPAHLDYLALSGHKLYAPFGSGALIGRRDTFAAGEPELKGGGTVRAVSPEHVVWADAPDRDEAGSPNVVGAVAMAAAMRALEAIGFDRLARHEAALTERLLRGLAAIDGVQVHGETDPACAKERLGVVPFALRGVPHGLVAAILSAEHGIGVRNGCFCAHPYLAQLLGLSDDEARQVQARLAADDRRDVPGLVRVSFGLYNTAQEVDRLLLALRAIVRGEHARDYRLGAATGDWSVPEGLPPPAHACAAALDLSS